MIQVLYFARFREQLNCASEEIEPTPDSVLSLMEQLKSRGGEWADLFATGQTVMVAVNQEMAGEDTPLQDGDEVAFFPPVTGG